MPALVFGGFTQLNRKLRAASPAIEKAMQAGLRDAAEPVKRDAEQLARSGITRMTATTHDPPAWSIDRIGVTTRGVYIAPRERGVKSRTDRSRRRPNLAGLLLDNAFDPALERNEYLVAASVDRVLTKVIAGLDA